MPLTAKLALRPRLCSASRKRQKPTRMPYSCQAQFGTSGSSGWPIGGGSTARGIGPLGLPVLDIDDGPHRDPRIARKTQRAPPVDRLVRNSCANAAANLIAGHLRIRHFQ